MKIGPHLLSCRKNNSGPLCETWCRGIQLPRCKPRDDFFLPRVVLSGSL